MHCLVEIVVVWMTAPRIKCHYPFCSGDLIWDLQLSGCSQKWATPLFIFAFPDWVPKCIIRSWQVSSFCMALKFHEFPFCSVVVLLAYPKCGPCTVNLIKTVIFSSAVLQSCSDMNTFVVHLNLQGLTCIQLSAPNFSLSCSNKWQICVADRVGGGCEKSHRALTQTFYSD